MRRARAPDGRRVLPALLRRGAARERRGHGAALTARAALLLLLAAAAPAAAETAIRQPPDLCAALWEGFADAFGDRGERALAARFRSASAARIGAAETDRLIAERRPMMRDLLDAYVGAQDRQSRDLFTRLLRGCALTEADLPPAR